MRPFSDPMTLVLDTYRNAETTDFSNAWVGMEPTFQNEKSVRKWAKMAAKPGGEDAYFEDPYLLKLQKNIAKSISRRYKAERAEGRPYCMFARVTRECDRDQWDVQRQNLLFHWDDANLEPFEVRVSLDPETLEYSIKPVPLVWFYDERFVAFCENLLWKVPDELGLSPSIAHGGAQFSFSAKTYLGGSLLADDIAYKVSHPELSTWIMDWPNPDDRAFRATRQRLAAFQQVLDDYWAGRFHARALGVLTADNAYFHRGFGPALSPRQELMDPSRGPVGDAREVFQTNFAFGRTIRHQAQNMHPGYWQSAHRDEEGYRLDQIMRYSEGNLNRLQIAGELHVKSGKVLDPEKIPELNAPLALKVLASEASWENRGQMSRTSARDFVEAMLLDVHHAQYLQAHPHVSVARSLVQDQLLGDAEETIQRNGGAATLDRLRREALKVNLEESRGRMKTDWIEPETLFWAAWQVLPAGEKAAVAREAIAGFVERVDQAATMDPRLEFKSDPMEWHRHRIHPLLWAALENVPAGNSNDPVRKELEAWQARKAEYLARRPQWSQVKGSTSPWEEAEGAKHE